MSTLSPKDIRWLVIPKEHATFAHELSDESLADLLPVAKRVAKALDAPNYNILQNNGRLAHQVVEHVHFHIIPKPNEEEGLGVGWPGKTVDKEELKALAEQISAKI
ncbi:hit family protein 1 [Spizellomyces punctatus DAOM BR117]|uniref:Hit family protein 1 n=1 Tax=Spizellomyces punctatus (strain DAOM BR117) TaxID=645134 RepID=A0A0L0HVT4_SPIPD|nr:hit family protein 1 [Spizellomyces punctatus DAOM BR117]KND05010.1 hit family protein 1 [Spizellomyces punctatus DAOM BR117]|eukprot:XP_016613049.1 hit family protein 1 [Spizellomyces punctatus DAOM BR117]